MNLRLKAKAAVALAAMAMFVGLVGSPAGAEILTAHIQIDDLHIYVPPVFDPDNPCPEGDSDLEADYTTTNPGYFDVVSFHVEGAFEIAPGDWWWGEVDYLGTNASGTVTPIAPPPPTRHDVTGLDIVLGFSLIDVDDDDCEPIGSPCSGVFGVLLDGILDTNPNPDVVSLSGGSVGSMIGDVDFLDTSCGGAVGPYQGQPVIVHYLTAEVP